MTLSMCSFSKLTREQNSGTVCAHGLKEADCVASVVEEF